MQGWWDCGDSLTCVAKLKRLVFSLQKFPRISYYLTGDPMPRGRPKKSHSISELRALLGEQRKRRAQLLGDRKKFQAKIDQVDREIAMLDGQEGAAGGRSRNDKSLPDVIESVLKKSGKPMKVGDIVAGAENAGYRSSSVNFRGIVNQALIKDERFTAASRGHYKLA